MTYTEVAYGFVFISMMLFNMILSFIIRSCVDPVKFTELPGDRRSFPVYREPFEILNSRGKKLYLLRRYIDYTLFITAIIFIIYRRMFLWD